MVNHYQCISTRVHIAGRTIECLAVDVDRVASLRQNLLHFPQLVRIPSDEDCSLLISDVTYTGTL
mgnify:CR=1 FL=1